MVVRGMRDHNLPGRISIYLSYVDCLLASSFGDNGSAGHSHKHAKWHSMILCARQKQYLLSCSLQETNLHGSLRQSIEERVFTAHKFMAHHPKASAKRALNMIRVFAFEGRSIEICKPKRIPIMKENEIDQQMNT